MQIPTPGRLPEITIAQRIANLKQNVKWLDGQGSEAAKIRLWMAWTINEAYPTRKRNCPDE